MSLPVPHALTLTSIVIGVAVLALMLSLIIHIYKIYGTLDVRNVGREEE
jgi:multicomponent Na+:H+ antiporter subunit C